MKNVIRVGPAIVLALCMLVGGTAFADLDMPDWPSGYGWLQSFQDHTSMYRDDEPLTATEYAGGAGLQEGDEARAVLTSHGIYQNDNLDLAQDTSQSMWASMDSEITAVQYGLVIPTSTGVAGTGQWYEWDGSSYVKQSSEISDNTYYISDTSTNVEIFIDDFNYDASQGPDAWTSQNEYPTASDGTALMQAVYKPLFDDVDGDLVKDATEKKLAFWDADGNTTTSGDQAWATYRVSPTTTPNAQGWLEVQGDDYLADLMFEDTFGTGYDMYMESEITGGTYNDGDNDLVWSTSDDPLIYAAPEPASMLLFGSAMAGCVAAYRRRKNK